jgi:hypothetical protein
MSIASVKTFREITENGLLSLRRRQVYTAIHEMEKEKKTPYTMGEVAWKVANNYKFPKNYRHNTIARLCELEEAGVVERVGERKCTFSGHLCTTWRTVNALPIKKKKKKKVTKDEVIKQLTQENRELKIQLRKALRGRRSSKV